jgi:hypothetical protein
MALRVVMVVVELDKQGHKITVATLVLTAETG